MCYVSIVNIIWPTIYRQSIWLSLFHQRWDELSSRTNIPATTTTGVTSKVFERVWVSVWFGQLWIDDQMSSIACLLGWGRAIHHRKYCIKLNTVIVFIDCRCLAVTRLVIHNHIIIYCGEKDFMHIHIHIIWWKCELRALRPPPHSGARRLIRIQCSQSWTECEFK